MILNRKKTKCLPFINSHTRDFIQQLSVEPGTNLEVIYQLRLVGLVINSEMTWDDHIDYNVGRVNKTFWQLTIFKQLEVDRKKTNNILYLKSEIDIIVWRHMFSFCPHPIAVQKTRTTTETESGYYNEIKLSKL